MWVMKPRYLILLIILIGPGSAGWWYAGRGPAIGAAAASRGSAAEIVYATGDVEPIRWAKVASVIRERIIEVCNCEGGWRGRLDSGSCTTHLRKINVGSLESIQSERVKQGAYP